MYLCPCISVYLCDKVDFKEYGSGTQAENGLLLRII